MHDAMLVVFRIASDASGYNFVSIYGLNADLHIYVYLTD